MKSSQTKNITPTNANHAPFFKKESNNNFFDNNNESFFNASPVQAKLTVNQPNDPNEKEADEMAGKVVQRLSDPGFVNAEIPAPFFPASASTIQRLQTSDEPVETSDEKDNDDEDLQSDDLQKELAFESNAEPPDDDENIQRRGQVQLKPGNAGEAVTPLTTASNEVSASFTQNLGKGRPLENGVKNKMENAFNTDFAGVEIHTDHKAHSISDQMDARAFTIGNHVAFGNGEYNPGSIEGDALMAHELAHVIQQKEGVNGSSASHNSLLEEDANQTSVEVTHSIFGLGHRPQGRKIMPKLKSGLRLSRCTRSSHGPIGATRRAEAVRNFESNNTRLTATEKTKIISSITIVTASNPDLEIAFYDYYSNHEILKDTSITGNELALTDPNSDTRVNPSVLAPSYANNSLGALLLHEFTHTRHSPNFMGSRDYQEGEAYAVEYFFAERTGDTARMGVIASLVSRPGGLSAPALYTALLMYFRKTYATLKALYEVIDTGTTSYSSSPIATPALLTREDARRLATELISVQESARSAQLAGIYSWVSSNLALFRIPI